MNLDAKTNAEEREVARLASEVQPPLNAPFPYVTLHFNPFFFGLDRDARPKEEE